MPDAAVRHRRKPGCTITTTRLTVRYMTKPLAKFSTWLYRIAHHRLLDHYRQHARNVADLFDGAIDPDELPAADSAL